MTLTLRSFWLLAVAVFAFALASWGQSCSNSILTGLYGYGGNGVDASGNPIAFEGVVAADGNGNLAGTQTESVNGVISLNVSTLGKYSIASNCNGTMTIQPSGSSAANYNVTVASGGARAFGLESDSGTVVSMYARAVEETGCTSGGTKGTFGFSGTGLIVGVGFFAQSGQVTLNGSGKLSGIQSFSVAGKVSSNVKFTGTYKVSSNCSGSAIVKIKGQSAAHVNFTLVRQLASIFFIQTDPKTVIVGWDRE